MSDQKEASSDQPPGATSETNVDNDRRDALRRLGKYTAPVMLAILLSERAVAQTGTT